jgi:hypothetical protein
MYETYEIPEKEVIPSKKSEVEKEKQFNQEEKSLTVTA